MKPIGEMSAEEIATASWADVDAALGESYGRLHAQANEDAKASNKRWQELGRRSEFLESLTPRGLVAPSP